MSEEPILVNTEVHGLHWSSLYILCSSMPFAECMMTYRSTVTVAQRIISQP